MKKSKILLVTVLALVLCLLCVTTSTFSWLPRPKSEKGNSLFWSPSYETSVGKDISMQTFELTEDGKEPETPQEVTDFSNAEGIAPGSRKYYRTDITNSGTDAQSVSLYLSSLNLAKKDGSFHLGVNSPLRTYKSYPNGGGSSAVTNTKVSADSMRVYFKPNGIWTENTFVIYVDGSWYADLTLASGSESNRVFYADIPVSAKKIYFAVQNWTQNYQKTYEYSINSLNPKLSATQSLTFIVNSGTTGDGYINSSYSSADGANIAKYYQSIEITNGSNFSAALTKNSDYIGQTIEYYSGDDNIFSVNKNSGLITAKAVGSAKLYSKVIGTNSDVKQVETIVNVVQSTEVGDDALKDVPVVTNVRVAGATGEGSDRRSTVVSVYWYIKNEGSDTLTYTIDDVYLTL